MDSADIKCNHNNVSHAVRMGLIAKKNNSHKIYYENFKIWW